MKQWLSRTKRNVTLLLISMTLMPCIAYADTNSSKIESVLRGLIELITSGIARLLFVLAIIAIGFGWLYLGRLPKERAVGAIIGIGIVFSAGWIAGQMGLGI